MTDIVIVNWNSGHFLERCISSVFAGSNPQFISQVIIIDNNSADGSASFINADNKTKLIRNENNNGFAKACNQGFKLCTAEYILLLNPDAILLEDTLQEGLQFLQKQQDVDIMGCQLIDDNGHISPSCSRFPTPLHIFFDATGLSKVAPKFFTPATVMTDWDHKESRYADQVMGAFMLMRKTVFDKLGYFDERFFVYYEEVDFCKRLSNINGRTFYNASIRAVHSGEGTTQRVKAFRLFLSLRSRLLYSKKHFSTLGYISVWVSTFFIEPFARSIFLLLRLSPGEIPDVWKGIRMLVVNKTLPAVIGLLFFSV
ncbi:MAG: glycosyltransferase family 2 protein [Ferruginibacter sp.]